MPDLPGESPGGAALTQAVEHPHVRRRREQGIIRVADQHASGSAISRFNTRLAVSITRIVGSMWCAYSFGAFDLISLPSAIHTGLSAVISWIAQTFLQLVLLSIIMVGQNVQADASDKRAEQTFHDVEAILHGHSQLASALSEVADLASSLHARLDALERKGGASA